MPQNRSPKLSILLSAYNTEKYIEEAIKGILNQTFQDFELIIADDNSKDDTKKIINSYSSNPRIVISNNSKNIGKTATINRLFKLSRGAYITIHDADDFSLPDRFAKQIHYLEKFPETIMCGCSFISFAESGFNDTAIMEGDYEIIKRNILEESQFHGPTMVIRKRIIEEQMDSTLLRPFFQDYNEDCDLAIRLVEIGKCTNLKDVLYQYRILPHSLSKTITPRKKSLYKLLVHFHHQRMKNEKDDLQNGNTDLAEKRLRLLQENNYSDPSKIYRESASFYMYYKLYRDAVKAAFKAVQSAPFQFKNWSTAQYCIRKFIFRS